MKIRTLQMPVMGRCLWLYALIVFAALGGCTDPERLDFYERSWSVTGPVVLDRQVAFLDQGRERLVLLTVQGAEVSARHIPTVREPRGMIASPNNKLLAVLSARDRAVTVIDVEAGSERVYPLGQPFDQLVFSDDSARLLAHFSPGAQVPRDELFNPNAYAVIDLERGDIAAATSARALRSFGSAPYAVYWVPPFALDDSGLLQEYALFLFDSYVTFADLNDPSFEVTVQLTLSATDPVVKPRRVLFSSAEGVPALQSAFVYLLADARDDIYTINLLPSVAPSGQARLAPSVNQLPSGRGPADMATFTGPDGREKLLVVNTNSADVSLVDAATASVLHVPLEATANKIYLYEGLDAQSGEIQPFALLYNGSGGSVVSFVKLHQLQTRRNQAISALSLRAGVQSLFQSSVEGQAVVVHSGGQGLSIVDLAGQFANPLQAGVALQDVEHDASGQRLFATLNSSSTLNMIDLTRSQPSALHLDFTIDDLLWLPKANALLALHSDDAGLITALEIAPGATPSRERAKIHAGFFLQGLFNEAHE
jgi:DNA-binding beta-propeller fold protein YncE